MGLGGLGHLLDHPGEGPGAWRRGRAWPCQKPRPGQACSTAMPTKNRPMAAQDHPAQPGRRPNTAPAGRPGPRPTVEQHRPRRPEQPGQTGGEDPAEGLAEHPHDRPQAQLATPASRDQSPRGATSKNSPIPTWIHTVAAAAATGW